MRLLLLAMWVGWLAYWAIAARGSKATQWRAPMRTQWLHYALAWIGTILLAVPYAVPAILRAPFLPPSTAGVALGIVLTAIGLLVVYARRYLDRLPLNNRALSRLPILSAAIVTTLGLVILVRSFTGAF